MSFLDDIRAIAKKSPRACAGPKCPRCGHVGNIRVNVTNRTARCRDCKIEFPLERRFP